MPSVIGNWRSLSKAEKEIVSKLCGVRKLGMDSFGSDILFAKLNEVSKYYFKLLRRFN